MTGVQRVLFRSTRFAFLIVWTKKVSHSISYRKLKLQPKTIIGFHSSCNYEIHPAVEPITKRIYTNLKYTSKCMFSFSRTSDKNVVYLFRVLGNANYLFCFKREQKRRQNQSNYLEMQACFFWTSDKTVNIIVKKNGYANSYFVLN